ncbi:MAG: cytochrome c biogenesis CcdA family protein [bacterium]
MQQVSILTAFIAGFLSFLSPCVLPLVPGYLSFISGVSLDEIRNSQDKHLHRKAIKKVAINSLLFILGFSIIFILLGASATFIGGFLRTKMMILSKIAGVIIIIFGLHIIGIFKLKFLLYEERFHFKNKPLSWLGTILVGMAFSFGWSPCIGPILAAILFYASTQETVYQGIGLLLGYSMGLGIPFFIAAITVNTFLGLFNWLKKYMRVIEIISGIFLILFGILILMNKLQYLASKFMFLQRFTI